METMIIYDCEIKIQMSLIVVIDYFFRKSVLVEETWEAPRLTGEWDMDYT